MLRGFRGIFSHFVLRYSTIFLTTVPLCLRSFLFLEIQDGLLAEENQHLPFPGHIVSAFQHFYGVQDFIAVVFVGTQKVIVCNPQSQIIVGTVDVVKAVCFPVGRFIGPVQALDHLLEWTELFGNRIVVGKSDHLGNAELESLPKFMEELLGSQKIGTVSVGNKAEIFWKLFEVPESHAHCHDAGTDAAVVRDLVTDDGALRSIHDEPDISFDTTNLDIGFIGSESVAGMIVIVVHERFYTDSGSLTVVGDLLV